MRLRLLPTHTTSTCATNCDTAACTTTFVAVALDFTNPAISPATALASASGALFVLVLPLALVLVQVLVLPLALVLVQVLVAGCARRVLGRTNTVARERSTPSVVAVATTTTSASRTRLQSNTHAMAKPWPGCLAGTFPAIRLLLYQLWSVPLQCKITLQPYTTAIARTSIPVGIQHCGFGRSMQHVACCGGIATCISIHYMCTSRSVNPPKGACMH